MKKAARTDNGAEPGRSAWGGRCCGVHHRRRFHELALGGGSGPHTAFIQSKHREGKQWRRFHTHPFPLPRSMTSHHRQKKKQWSQSDDACEGLDQTAAPGGHDRYPEQSSPSSSFLNHICLKEASKAWFGSCAAASESLDVWSIW